MTNIIAVRSFQTVWHNIKREDRRKEILEVKTFSQEGQQNTDVLGYMRIKAYLYILKSDSWEPEMKMKSLSQKLK